MAWLGRPNPQIRGSEATVIRGVRMRVPLGLQTLLGWTLFAALPYAQDSNSQSRTPVRFECNCTDEVGQLYATAFRDLLAKSPRFVSETGFDKGGGSLEGPPSLLVNVVSLDPSHEGQISVLSEVFLVGSSTYLNHSVRWCPKDRASSCAAFTFAELDDQAQHLLSLRSSDKTSVKPGANPNNLSVSSAGNTVKTKNAPWQDAILTGFSDVPTAANCDSSGTAKPDQGAGEGSYSTESSASCANLNVRQWTILLGGHRFVIMRDIEAPGIVGAFLNKDVLRGLTPGTHIAAWGDGREIQVKVGGKLTKYKVVSAE
jgi:hypothetical protein